MYLTILLTKLWSEKFKLWLFNKNGHHQDSFLQNFNSIVYYFFTLGKAFDESFERSFKEKPKIFVKDLTATMYLQKFAYVFIMYE